MFSGEYGWMPKKKIKPKVKLFGGDDFKFFIFISIFIFCLAGLVLLITGVKKLKYRLGMSRIVQFLDYCQWQ